MIWCRSHGRLWGMAALLALTLQIALSFGHGHSFDARSSAALATTGGNVSVPSPPGGTDHDEDYCATCAILALLAGAQAVNAPAVAPPAALAMAEIVLAFEAIRISASPASFQSRAPPLS
jgi:hypothetical protein